ncbi:hypothetical protein BJ508DRAFT_375354 [Ascobolus immersus RN42]|uniref:Uncharacterized protein n=1 Tax=Ascobolus immersus RN42 TaxID=1160509 RepID=A0A3N4I9S5_ASCIM|nr:hypothetical protein BJ508DRAFT_375354 [Ascobolus immersus RN42]
MAASATESSKQVTLSVQGREALTIQLDCNCAGESESRDLEVGKDQQAGEKQKACTLELSKDMKTKLFHCEIAEISSTGWEKWGESVALGYSYCLYGPLSDGEKERSLYQILSTKEGAASDVNLKVLKVTDQIKPDMKVVLYVTHGLGIKGRSEVLEIDKLHCGSLVVSTRDKISQCAGASVCVGGWKKRPRLGTYESKIPLAYGVYFVVSRRSTMFDLHALDLPAWPTSNVISDPRFHDSIELGYDAPHINDIRDHLNTFVILVQTKPRQTRKIAEVEQEGLSSPTGCP